MAQRITRLYLLELASFAEVFARHGLSFGEWEVLAILRRSGPPHRMNPTALYAELVLSSGAMTNRLDRLEAAGLLERRPDPFDRRGTLVSLTKKGMRAETRSLRSRWVSCSRSVAESPSRRRSSLARWSGCASSQTRTPATSPGCR